MTTMAVPRTGRSGRAGSPVPPRAQAASVTAGPVRPDTAGHQIQPAELLAIAEGLTRSARTWPGMRRPRRRCWDLMVASDAFEAWVIGWPPGGAIEFHDHGDSAGAVVVASGELTETTVTDGSHGIETEARVLPESASTAFGTAYVHDVVNLGTAPAVSVHVYAPRLTTMTYYEITDGRLAARHTTRYRLGEAMP